MTPSVLQVVQDGFMKVQVAQNDLSQFHTYLSINLVLVNVNVRYCDFHSRYLNETQRLQFRQLYSCYFVRNRLTQIIAHAQVVVNLQKKRLNAI